MIMYIQYFIMQFEHPVWGVVEFKRVCGELLIKGRQLVVTWSTTGRECIPGLGDSRGVACLGVVTLTERLVTAWDLRC
jgi:hypothetical protein